MKWNEVLNEATIKQELPMNKVTEKIKPWLMTFEEYEKIANPSKKFHESDAYDWSLADMNKHEWDNVNGMKLYGTKNINGISFSIYGKVQDRTEKTYNTDDPSSPNGYREMTKSEKDQQFANRKYDYDFKIVDDRGNIVGTAQDEWGALLIVVAREYRGFGLGPLLGSLMRKYRPEYDSGGMTSSGKYNLMKIHTSMVRQAMESGTYSKMVRDGSMSKERANAIIASAHLDKTKRQSVFNTGDKFTNDPKHWLVGYINGAFIIYNKKLFKMFNDDSIDDSFKERMILGMGYAGTGYNNSEDLNIFQFGGQNDKIKRYAMALMMADAQRHGNNMRVSHQIESYVDTKRAKKTRDAKFYSRDEVTYTPTGYADMLPVQLIKQEKDFRKRHDKYGEFENWLTEEATSMFDDYLK